MESIASNRVLAASLAWRSPAGARAAFDALAGFARGCAAIELAVAMIVAWAKRRDPAELGHVNLAAFYRERVDWKASWRAELVGLVEGPLDLVKRAACEGLVPLRLAARARCAPGEQSEWLGDAAYEPPPPRRLLDPLTARDSETVRAARRLARPCLGRSAPIAEIDAYIVDTWRERVPAREILARAYAPPGPPPPPPPLSWEWCRAWSEPASVLEALAALDRLQAALRGREVVLARAWAVIARERLWEGVFDGAARCAEEVLGVSLRQAQRLRRVGQALGEHPELERAVRAALPMRLAESLSSVLTPATAGAWLEIAARAGRLEVSRAVAHARARGELPVLAAYREVLDLAGEPPGATSARTRVAIPHPDEEDARPGAVVRAPPDLVPAAAWWVATVRIPRAYGFSRVKARDRYRCQNPECASSTLRVEAHHVVFRRTGGSNEEANGVTLCRVCHLRGVHGGRLAVRAVRLGGRLALVWEWPDGRRVVALRELRAQAANAA